MKSLTPLDGLILEALADGPPKGCIKQGGLRDDYSRYMYYHSGQLVLTVEDVVDRALMRDDSLTEVWDYIDRWKNSFNLYNLVHALILHPHYQELYGKSGE